MKHIAIIGGGPSGLFVFKRLLESGRADLTVTIYEAGARLGEGMPYGPAGASAEHVTNVSADEIPDMPETLAAWVAGLSPEDAAPFAFDAAHYNAHKVLPRLLMGRYLGAQFDAMVRRAAAAGLAVDVRLNRKVADVMPEGKGFRVHDASGEVAAFDHVVICTGHDWPRPREAAVPGYYDSPYPPDKLARRFDHPVAVRGSSLTAVDAVRTLARHNGDFSEGEGGLVFTVDPAAPDFRVVMYSRHALLPALRFHSDHPHIGHDSLIPDDEIAAVRAANDGFLPLDFAFERTYREPLKESDPDFHAQIAGLTLEQFVERMLGVREEVEPFALFRREYAEAETSIRQHRSIHWKEELASLSFALNYPAKHFSAEDMLRHRRVLMPLIGVIIAFVPQSSARELLALHDAGRLSLMPVGGDCRVEPAETGATIIDRAEDETEVRTTYATFVDCIGQPALPLEAFPFKSLVTEGALSPAWLAFRSDDEARGAQAAGNKDVENDGGRWRLRVPGAAVDDDFRAIGVDGIANPRLHLMAVPYMAGFNPDYSGLDFCEEASRRIVGDIMAA